MGKEKVDKKTYFQDSWLKDPKFREWLKKHTTDKTKFRCKLCQNKEMTLSNMGTSALTSHAKSSCHIKVIQGANPLSRLFFTTPSSQSSAIIQSSSQSASIQSSSSTSKQKDENADGNAAEMPLDDAEIALNAEIRWALKCVTAHYSYRSNMDNRLLFQAMAPGYKPFERFHMSKDKVRYYIVYGLAPFFKSLLIEALNKSPYLTVMFDESLNDNIQTNQMDIQVRYWDVSNGKAITQYMDSKFIARGNACNISTELIQFMKEDVPPRKVVALSMDGPTVNWNVLKVINKNRTDDEMPELADLGNFDIFIFGKCFTRQTTAKVSFRSFIHSLIKCH